MSLVEKLDWLWQKRRELSSETPERVAPDDPTGETNDETHPGRPRVTSVGMPAVPYLG